MPQTRSGAGPLVQAVNDATRRLDEGYQRQKRIVVDTAHELRTPVAILPTRVETLEDSPTRTKPLADASRVAALAEQLLDIQRLNVIGIDQTPVDLVALRSEVAADMAPFAIQQGRTIALDAGLARLHATGDAGALRRALINRVQNALEHSDSSDAVMIRAKSDYSVEVADHGCGILPEEREAIFEPFHRPQHRDHGAGLGLNLVREIVQKHGAAISVGDESGGGACFRITFSPPRSPLS